MKKFFSGAVILMLSLLLTACPDYYSEWTLNNGDAQWNPRAGLQTVKLGDAYYLMGGRTPNDSPIPGDSEFWGDVWKSTDRGVSWERILDTDNNSHWPARAYFQAVTLEDYIYILGGQNFKLEECPPVATDCEGPVPASDFFNDVWRSNNGFTWEQMTPDAPWQGRAGHMAAVLDGRIYVLGGSANDDSSIVGPTGPERIYFNDVWSSVDGKNWELITDAAPWPARAGGAVVVRDGTLFLLGGEAGFLCSPLPCDLPYFNDVWATQDGETWQQVTAEAEWSARPGHKCGVLMEQIVCFGGFNFPFNPVDTWVSPDGASWTRLITPPWNAVNPDEIKYDFDILVDESIPAIMTFGGDRETFNFNDPENYLRVDNDVWQMELKQVP